MFVRTHTLDQLMVLLPMLRFLRIFLLLRRSCICEHGEDRVDCEHRDRGRLCERVLKWRVEHDAPGATMTTFRAAIWWAVVTTTTTVGYGDYIPVTDAGLIGA